MKKVLDSPILNKDLEKSEKNNVMNNFKISFKDIVLQVEKEVSSLKLYIYEYLLNKILLIGFDE